MTETIQQLKEDIAILQKKLQKLEEQERTKSRKEKDYKRMYGVYPNYNNPSQWEMHSWDGFFRGYDMGYSAAQEDYKVGKYQPTPQTSEEVMEKLGFVKNSDGNWTAEPFKALQRKLEKLEKTKSPVEEAYKDWWGEYPETGIFASNTDDARWLGFAAGYNAAYKEPEENEWKLVALRLGEKLSDNGPGGYYDFTPGEWFEWALNECEREMIKRNLKTSLQEMVNGDVRPIDDVMKEAQERGERLHKDVERCVRESVRWCEEHPNESIEDWVKPQTPEQVADGLKEAFREAVKQGVVSSVDKPKDDLIDKMVAELKGETLTDLIWKWWEDVFTTHEEWDAENAIEELVNRIERFLPKEQSAAGSQNAYVESAVEGFNDCLNKIKRKLR